MKVSEIMRSPAQTVLPETSVTDVARIIQRHHYLGSSSSTPAASRWGW